jgi:hypothetical protein
MNKRVGLVYALWLFACSSNGGDDSPITIEGQLFSVASASSGVVTASNSEYAQIILSSQADACEQIGSGIEHPQQQTIIIDVGAGAAPPTASGAYPVSDAGGSPPAGQYAQVYAISTDANCQLTLVPEPNGVSGTVTLTSVANGALSGMFDVMFDTGDHVTGSFSADSCPAIGSASDDPTCK